MDRRQFLAPLAALCVAGPAWASGKPYRAPRTRLGAPQLEGLWTNATYTELERPDAFKSLVADPAAAKAWEARLAKTGGLNVPVDPLGQAQSEFPESGAGLARIRGEIRTSWIVDPPDGKLPYTEAIKKKLAIGQHREHPFDNPEDRTLAERCLSYATDGGPILSSADANVLKIVQTPDAVVVLTEKDHGARVIWMAAAAPPPGPRCWRGHSVAHWDGDTLVARTDNFSQGVLEHGDDLYLSGDTRLEERFTRISPSEILYEFTVTDPALFTRPWRAEMVFTASSGEIYEYACHEGNYSIVNILSAARQGRQGKPAEGKGP